MHLAERGVAKEACEAYLEKGNDASVSREVSDALLAAIADDNSEEAAFIRQNEEFLTKKSVWAFGGDGWAYDIGYGGLDHVLASGKDINILVLDTEVYSNTGGQASKSTATGAVAKFCAGGKQTKKKDLGLMAMSYGYVYVAQVAMGADPAQTLKAIREAEAYDGPSIIICYCPCIEHGMKCGMGLSQKAQKDAVEAGYWHLYRYNPDLKDEGKNPFIARLQAADRRLPEVPARPEPLRFPQAVLPGQGGCALCQGGAGRKGASGKLRKPCEPIIRRN